MQDIDSLPDAALPEPPPAGQLRWPVVRSAALRWHAPRRPALRFGTRDLEQLLAWISWIDLAWVVLWILGLAGILLFERWEAIPFHLIWVSFALLYSFRVRTTGATLWVLAAMAGTTFAAIGFDVLRGADSPAELTEVPLMAAMVWVMLWHGRRRQAANAKPRS